MGRRGLTAWILAAFVAALVAGCGGGGDDGGATTATTPSAPGAPLADRALGADELGIAGMSSTGALATETTVDGAVGDDDCAPTREAARLVLSDAGFQGSVRRAWAGDGRGAISVVSLFETTAGAKAWGQEILSMNGDTPAQCLQEGETVTTPTHESIPSPPGAVLQYATRTSGGETDDVYNVVFQDGRFLYVTGAAGPQGTIDPDTLVAAANLQWARRAG